ncbi:M23 family metallopeptidase [Yinghuangia seranimata]|uniref:M23 family metallopeptidase n=1 Tax=Yinghuangia seranimata TaxID=408067 RepID=UPI00248C23F3|nr:peptidoglycan DD-metalloendopeptidase family protein [Yinghuangia seranimata]MDI2126798.1 peptidoglycan DD-metalloendopeptidase family protein [Yinghuangia seranimata]
MTDGRYPDGDPYGRGVPDDGMAYTSGDYAAYQAHDSGAYNAGGYQQAAPGGYAADAYAGYDSGAYNAYQATGSYSTGYDASYASGTYEASAYEAASYDASGQWQTAGYGTADTTGGYAADGYGTAVQSGYDSGAYNAYQATGSYDAPYDSGGYPAAGYGEMDPNAAATAAYAAFPHQASYDTAYDAAAWSGDVMTATAAPQQADPWSADAATTAWPSTAAGTDLWTGGDNRLGSDAFTDAHRNESGAAAGWYDEATIVQQAVPAYDSDGSGTWDAPEPWAHQAVTAEADAPGDLQADADEDDDAHDETPDGTADADTDEDAPRAKAASVATAASAAATAAELRSRAARRKTTKRTRPMAKVAGGSLAVMGAAAMAVAAAGGIQAADAQGDSSASGRDVPLAASPLDQQFTDLRDGAEDFADRASRAQARVALQERQEEIARQQDEDRKKRESLRPKYVLPVRPGLSAYFGQAGGRWSHLHTGIDFPVDRGTPVRAVTDGVVRTEWNSAYGNMVIVTAPDGTETWYCHLTRAKVVSGPVKAGDVIAYSGNSGNSTGPHLHLEVRPGGGQPINPIPWLRDRGLDPTG